MRMQQGTVGSCQVPSSLPQTVFAICSIKYVVFRPFSGCMGAGEVARYHFISNPSLSDALTVVILLGSNPGGNRSPYRTTCLAPKKRMHRPIQDYFACRCFCPLPALLFKFVSRLRCRSDVNLAGRSRSEMPSSPSVYGPVL